MACFRPLGYLRRMRPMQFPLFLILLYDTPSVWGFTPAQNHAVQVDFSKTFEEVDLPGCANDRVVNLLMADRDIAFVLPERTSSGIPSLDALSTYFKLEPSEQELVNPSDVGNQGADIPTNKDDASHDRGSCNVGGGDSDEGCGLENVSNESSERFPDIRGAGSLILNEVLSPSCPLPSLLSPLLRRGSPENESYIRAARLRWLLDRCFRFGDKTEIEWKYELCVG